MIRLFLATILLFFTLGVFAQTGPLDTTLIINGNLFGFTAVNDSTYFGSFSVKSDQIPPWDGLVRTGEDVNEGDIVIDQIGKLYRIDNITNQLPFFLQFECVELQETNVGPSGNGEIVKNNQSQIYPVAPRNGPGITPELFARIINNNLAKQQVINERLLASIYDCERDQITAFVTDSTFVVDNSVANIGDVDSALVKVFVNGQLRSNYTRVDSLVTLQGYTLLPGDTVETYFCANTPLIDPFEDRNGVYSGSDTIPDSTTAVLAGLFEIQDSNGVDLISMDTTVSFYNALYRLTNVTPPYDSSIQIWNALGVPDWLDAGSLGGGAGDNLGNHIATTNIQAINGTTGAPAITGTDTDSGFSFGTNTITFSTDGFQVGQFDAFGDLLLDYGIQAAYMYDSGGDLGTAGQVLSSTGVATNWIDAGDGNGIYGGSGSLSVNPTIVTGGARSIEFRNVPFFTVYANAGLTENINSDTDGFTANYHDGTSDNFSTLIAGIDAQNQGRFQYNSADITSAYQAQIEVNLNSSNDEFGFISIYEESSTSSDDINVMTGRYWGEEGFMIDEGAAADESFLTHYLHYLYDTQDTTLKIFDGALRYAYTEVPSTTSSATSGMRWNGDGTDANPEAYRKQEGQVTITGDGDGEISATVTFGATMPTADYIVSLAVEIVSGTLDVGEQVVTFTSPATTGFTVNLADAIETGEVVNIHWTVIEE